MKVRQGDGSCLVGNFVANPSFKVIDSSLVLIKFAMDAEMLDIGNRHIILSLCRLTENKFLVDT